MSFLGRFNSYNNNKYIKSLVIIVTLNTIVTYIQLYSIALKYYCMISNWNYTFWS